MIDHTLRHEDAVELVAVSRPKFAKTVDMVLGEVGLDRDRDDPSVLRTCGLQSVDSDSPDGDQCDCGQGGDDAGKDQQFDVRESSINV